MPFDDFIEVEIVEMLTTLVEDKDIYTGGHSKRVAMYASKIGEQIHLGKEEQEHLYYAGLLHDIGKVLTPDTVLLKPGKLKSNEIKIIKKHSVDSEKMVSAISSLRQYQKTIRHHHERYDGKGYPDGIEGEEIPLFSRILSIADAFDAMTTNRIYKQKKTIPEAIIEVQKCSDTQFDPAIVSKAIEVFESFTKTTDIDQVPHTKIEIERFAYFFKDTLTGAYSAKYLDYFLQENLNSKQFKCCYFIQVHHMHSYNKSFGWDVGNDTLMEVALRIKALFCSSFVFRVFGDDFVVLNPVHVDMDTKVFYKLTAGFDILKVSISHFDLHQEEMKNWKSLEKHLLKS